LWKCGVLSCAIGWSSVRIRAEHSGGSAEIQ
jgi:hypothetical protein